MMAAINGPPLKCAIGRIDSRSISIGRVGIGAVRISIRIRTIGIPISIIGECKGTRQRASRETRPKTAITKAAAPALRCCGI